MKLSDLNNITLKLHSKKLKVAFAESCTAGMLASEFVKARGTSDILVGSVVTYTQEAKQKLLSVKKNTIDLYTAESQQVTNEMVMGLHNSVKADICVAITGLCGPGATETPEKPVGTIFVSVFFQDKIEEHRMVFKGNALAIRKKATEFIYQRLEEIVDQYYN
jgi:nicotinamide-nucleotide amidase